MAQIVVSVEHVSKKYQLGTIGYGSFQKDLAAWWARIRGKEDPNSIVGEGKKPDTYKDFWALQDISFIAAKGDRIGIIGRNGAGKSTLLKILSQVTRPTSGEVKIRGKIASLLEVGTGFHAELTGRENVFLNGAILGMKRKEIQAKFDEIVNFAGVEEFIDTPVKRYSSGMYIRLGFAVAAHLDAEILIVDEVLAVGDAEFQKRCIGKMENVSTEEGRTIIFVSHNMTAISQLCPRAIYLESGKIKGMGTSEEIIAQYQPAVEVPLGQIVFPKEAGKHGAGFSKVSVVDENGVQKNVFGHESSFFMLMDYWVDQPLPTLRAGFKLINAHGVVVMHAATSDSSSLDGSVGNTGCHALRARIPGGLLTPGRYTVQLGLFTPGIGHHQDVNPAFSFEILSPEGMDSIGEEILRPKLEWRLETR